MYKTVWISTVARTGSMWTFNVTRQLLAAAGYNVLPNVVPQTNDEMLMCYEKAINDDVQSNIYCLKVHESLIEHIPNSKVITTIRDPRDVCLSFMNFMKSDFETAFEAGKSILRFVDLYERYSSDYVCFVKYEDLINHPTIAVKAINEFLKLNLLEDKIKIISDMFSKSNVAKIVDKKTNELQHKIDQRQSVDSREIVLLSENNFRAFDTDTGFQTGHISGSNAGDWRTSFSNQQKAVLNEAFGAFCQKFGFN